MTPLRACPVPPTVRRLPAARLLLPLLVLSAACGDSGDGTPDAADATDVPADGDVPLEVPADHAGTEDAAADADTTPDDGAGDEASGPDGAWRPFSDDSPWNTPLPADPELEPDSAALIADFASSSPWGPHLDVNIAGYSIPLYWADAATPTFEVLAGVGGEGWLGDNGMNAVGTMPIPDGAAPDPESDHHLLVIDRGRGLEWGCWNMRLETGGWRAGLCAASDLRGTGVRTPATVADPWWMAHGARACGFPLVAGLIRREEVAAGRIDHALIVAYPHIRAGWFTPPASTGQARIGDDAISTRGIPCGGRIQFDPAVDVDALDVSPAGKLVLHALQTYGAYVGDYSGALSLYAENSPEAQAYWAAGVLDSYELLDRIDLSRFRVLRLGTLYDNGNGD
ncbi:MAG: hypothetical protein JXB32_16230 [Deltaproteobacteria bacterium]|nr:hypothetical protein [Deltaproteobacteria bacterium]